MTLQNAAPVWAVTFNVTAGVGFQIDLFKGLVDINAQANLVNLTLTIAQADAVTTTSLPDATGGVPYSATVSATGGFTPYTWAFAKGSSPPSWLSITTQAATNGGGAKGALTGTPPAVTSPTKETITVAVTDSEPVPITATQQLTLNVVPNAPTIASFVALPSSLPSAGGKTTLSWTTANATSCSLSSSPAVSGFPATVPCNGASGAQSMTVNLPANTASTAASYAFTLTAKGGSGTTPASQSAIVTVNTPGSGGSPWTEVALPGAASAEAVSCPTASDCVAVGTDATGAPMALVTTNGGATWTQETMPASATALGPAFLSCATTSTCIVVGSNGNGTDEVLATADGGTTWTTESIAGADPYGLYGVSCASATSCVAVGSSNGSPVAWMTSDNGAAWTQETIPNAMAGYSNGAVSCPTASDCVAVGLGPSSQSGVPSGGAWYSSDGGATWDQGILPNASDEIMSGVSCADSSDCVATGFAQAGGEGAMWVTTDGGATWTSATVPGAADSPIHGVSCANANDCVAFGSYAGDGTAELWVTTDGGTTWTEEPMGTAPTIAAVSCAPAAPASASCVAVGEDATTNAGAAWIGSP